VTGSYDDLTQLRHAWVVFVLVRDTHPAIKQAVLEVAAQAGRRLPRPRKAVER
jgi:hypothetical protein